jgi:tetratricopeptide (TPR) repeat protein
MRNQEARAEFELALGCPAYTTKELWRARTTRRVATVLMRQGKLTEAERKLRECLEIEERHSSMRDMARSLRHLGRLEMMRKKPRLAAAQEYLTRAADIMEAIMNVRGIGAVRLNMATLARLQGKHESGLQFAEESLQTAEKLGACYGQALCLMELSALESCLGHPARARTHHRKAASILHRLHLDSAIEAANQSISWDEGAK